MTNFIPKAWWCCWSWWHTPLTPSLGRQRLANFCKAEASLVYKADFRPTVQQGVTASRRGWGEMEEKGGEGEEKEGEEEAASWCSPLFTRVHSQDRLYLVRDYAHLQLVCLLAMKAPLTFLTSKPAQWNSQGLRSQVQFNLTKIYKTFPKSFNFLQSQVLHLSNGINIYFAHFTGLDKETWNSVAYKGLFSFFITFYLFLHVYDVHVYMLQNCGAQTTACRDWC